DHGVNAGNLFSFAGVDTHDLRVSVLASQDAAVELVFQGQVDAVNAGADDALDAAHSRGAGAYYRVFNFCHGLTPSCHSIGGELNRVDDLGVAGAAADVAGDRLDRKSTRLNSSHVSISYAVF